MGALLCTLREPSLKKILRDGFNIEPPIGHGCDAYQCSATDQRKQRLSSLTKMKSYWRLKAQKRKRQLHPDLEIDEEKLNKPKKLTTIDGCLSASPPAGLIMQDSFIVSNGGRNLLHGQLSSAVLHPSLHRIHRQDMISASNRELVLVGGNENNGVLNRSQSETSYSTRRRVSFRMPADVIIFYPDHEE